MMCTSRMKVPFLLPRSLSMIPRSARVTRQCWRETRGSLTTGRSRGWSHHHRLHRERRLDLLAARRNRDPQVRHLQRVAPDRGQGRGLGGIHVGVRKVAEAPHQGHAAAR